jgi:hypothetical protein
VSGKRKSKGRVREEPVQRTATIIAPENVPSEPRGREGKGGGGAAAEGFWLLGQTHGHDETRREKQPADESNSPCDKKNPRKETEERGFGSLAFGRI